MATEPVDVAIIGAGPGGYVAAIRCAQLGLNTVCIDAWETPEGKPAPGGTCLNVGCIPSKALLDSTELWEQIHHGAADHGITVSEPRFSVERMMARKQDVVNQLTGGVRQLLKKNGVDFRHGRARFRDARTLEIEPVSGQGKAEALSARHIIIATGSEPVTLPDMPFDGERIVDSTGALAFEDVPCRLAIIGAGVIGLELGSVWRRLGSEVTVLEQDATVLPFAERALADELARLLQRQGMTLKTGSRVQSAEVRSRTVRVRYEQEGKEQTLTVDRLLVAVGRRPCTAGLNAEAAGLSLDRRGFVEVDDQCRTTVEGVYAIGDAVRGPMLAHKASEEGVMVAERIAGQAAELRYDTVPSVVYTEPELAWVGATTQELERDGVDFRAGTFPYAANGRALALGARDGRVRILADAESDRILGVHILGARASELIAEAVTAMEFSASAEDLARTIHAHPTLSEAVREAALAVDGRALHR